MFRVLFSYSIIHSCQRKRCHHGKKSMDGIGWTIKIFVFQKALSAYLVINKFLLLHISTTGWLYLESNKVLKEPQQKANVDDIFSTLNTHNGVHIPICYVYSNKLFTLQWVIYNSPEWFRSRFTRNTMVYMWT